MIDISNLRDVVDKNLEMYVPWDHIRGIISRHDAGEVIRMKLHDVKITKMLFILVAVGLFIWNLKRRAVCDCLPRLSLEFGLFPFYFWLSLTSSFPRWMLLIVWFVCISLWLRY